MFNRKKISKLSIKEDISGLLFILPSFSGFLLFILIPVVFSLYLSFCSWNFIEGFSAIKFVNIENYKNLLTDVWFKDSLRNTLIYTFVSVPACTIIGMLIAVIINNYIYFKRIIRTMIFIPYISSVVAICVVWMVLLHPSFGPINEFLRSIGIQNPPKWLTDMKWALPAILIIAIWQQIGYYVIVFLAGIQNIPTDLYEAANIDGANGWEQFWNITVPMLSPTTFFLVIMGLIGSFKVFDQISVLTKGGPGTSTTVIAYYIYKTAFQYFKMGYASAMSWILFIFMFAITVIQWKGQKKWVNYE